MIDPILINGLAVVGAGTCLYWLFRILSALLRSGQSSDEAVAPGPSAAASPTTAGMMTPDDVARDDIAVIAAAVYVMWPGHRIVHISDQRSGASWSADGRWMHQTSHNPH